MRVYIAQRGEKYEGTRILGVFASKRGAIKRALQEPAHFGDKYWQNAHTWMKDSCYWQNECDYIMVTDWDVEP